MLFCTVFGGLFRESSLNSNLNLKSITKIDETVTTGNTGNIATSYANDGKTFIVGAVVTNTTAYLRIWASPYNSGWYFTAALPNTGATINNTSLNIRYFVVKMDH